MHHNRQAVVMGLSMMLVASTLLVGLTTQSLAAPEMVAGQHVPNSDTIEISSISIDLKKLSHGTDGTVTVKIMQSTHELASGKINTDSLSVYGYRKITTQFNSVKVDGDFDIIIEFQGTSSIAVDTSGDTLPGNYFVGNREYTHNDIDYEVKSTTITTSTAEENNEEQGAGDSNSNDSENTGNNNENNASNNDNNSDSKDADQLLKDMVAGQHVPNSGKTVTIDSIKVSAKKGTFHTNGKAIIAIIQGEKIVDSVEVNAGSLRTSYKMITAGFDSVKVTGNFDVTVSYEGKGVGIFVDKDRDRMPGNYFTNSKEYPKDDMNFEMHITKTTTADPASNDDGTNDSSDSDASNGTTDTDKTIKLTVEAKDVADGTTPVNDMWIEIWEGNTRIDTGFTSKTFDLEAGKKYTVAVGDWGDTTFAKWKDGDQDRTRVATLTKDDTFTALYDTGSNHNDDNSTQTSSDNNNTNSTGTDPSPSIDDNNNTDPSPAGPGTVTVVSELLDGTPITGFLAQVRDGGNIIQEDYTPTTFILDGDKEYKAVMYWTKEIIFRQFSDGDLYRYHPVHATDTGQVLTAEYEKIPEDQQAKLQIIAKTSDGHVIGDSSGSDLDGTLQTSPGMNIELAPPGSLTPYTAAFTGSSSSLPFVVFNGKTYTATMGSYGQYQFSHWEDNNSTNPSRAFTMDGDITATAIYDVVDSASSSSYSAFSSDDGNVPPEYFEVVE